MHPQMWVKVNAPVDERIAPLIEALSEIEGLETLDSCQGDGEARAHVIFRYGSWKEIGRLFCERLLPEMSADLRSDVSLSLYIYDTDGARGEISLSTSSVEDLAVSIRRIRA